MSKRPLTKINILNQRGPDLRKWRGGLRMVALRHCGRPGSAT